ncbi:MAG TPA: hypothetical protein VNZ63_11105 [Verrucomicrobiae bacterium]|nr:hypothetical protein [Verrucomicrobiae bacterium]
MRKHCTVFAAVAIIVLLNVLGAAAQDPGPQGAGSDNAAAHSSAAPHSHNPLNWIKKNPDTKTEKTEKTKKTKNKKSSEKPAAQNNPQP